MSIELRNFNFRRMGKKVKCKLGQMRRKKERGTKRTDRIKIR